MNQHSIQISAPTRAEFIKRGRSLEYFTIGYNSLEGLIAEIDRPHWIWAGLGSTTLA